MDYDYPDLCIRSLEESRPGYYYIDMPSRYDATPQPIVEINQTTVDILMNHPDYPVAMCPPGWPNAPEVAE